MMKRWIVFLVPAILLLGMIGWRISQKNAETAARKTQQAARGKAGSIVEAAVAVRRDIVETYEAVGSAEAPSTVNVTPKVAGRLQYLQVREGDSVQAGQILARIDPAEVQADVRNVEATLAEAQSRLAQAQVTEDATNVGVGAAIQTQQAALATARAVSAQASADQGAQIAAAQAAVADAEGRVEAAKAEIASSEAAIRTAQANLENAQVSLQRQQSLVKEGATARQNLDNAQTILKVQQGALDEAGQRKENALAAQNSALAQQRVAERQVQIAQNKAKSDIAAAQAGVAQARATLSSAQANTSQRSAYQKNLQALAAAVRAAEANVRAAQARLGDTVLRSPLTGVVTQRSLDPGGLATPGQTIVTVQAIRQVWLTTSVPEEVSRSVYLGQTAVVRFDALSGEAYTGRITQLNPAADLQSRQFQIRVRLDNPRGRIKPGMSGQVVLETKRARNVVTVPREAVRFTETDRAADGDAAGAATVTVVTAENKAQVRNVRTGLSDDKSVAVSSGLEPGEKVVILTGREVKDGQSVRIAEAKRGKDGGASATAAQVAPPAGAGGGSQK
ncbi:MAG: efflux RND transporter periplasmic adaptor subunit [Cytophagales bacterium]|nr:efflux RND transporter periplasmic adaptor subunit [Armatimonadota bacterium]